MTIMITGANGHFGRLVVGHLLDRVAPAGLAVSVREPAKAADLAARGVDVRHGDFADPEGLDFSDVDTLLLVSIDGPDEQRAAWQADAVAAAARAGVRRIAYTSVTDADTSPLGLARVHAATERRIRETGLPFTFLRNGMYHENYTAGLPQALADGALVRAAGQGRVASASRSDLAMAAAAVLTEEGHDGRTYELTGARAWDFAELAAIAAEAAGAPLIYKAVAPGELRAGLLAAGLPPFVVDLLTDLDTRTAEGVLARPRPDLAELLGRDPVSIEEAVRAAL